MIHINVFININTLKSYVDYKTTEKLWPFGLQNLKLLLIGDFMIYLLFIIIIYSTRCFKSCCSFRNKCHSQMKNDLYNEYKNFICSTFFSFFSFLYFYDLFCKQVRMSTKKNKRTDIRYGERKFFFCTTRGLIYSIWAL